MKHALTIAVALVITASAVAQESKLHWSNGDSLPGQLLSVQSGQLQWQSPLFVGPLKLKTNFLTRVSIAQTATAPRGTWQIAMHNGDVLYGKLNTIRSGVFQLSSARHGNVSLDGAAIQSLRRMNNPALVYHGPNSLQGWKTYDDGDDSNTWKATSNGHLTTKTKDAELFRKLPTSGRVAMEIQLKCSRSLYFQLALSDRPKQSPRLEVWDNELVAAYGDDFEPILTLTKRDRVVSVQLFWDDKSGVFSVFDTAGKQLATIKAKQPKGAAFGVYLRNQGTDLTLEKIHVSKWNGQQPKPVRVGETRVHLLDGNIAYGRVSELTAKGQLSVRVKQGSKKFSLANVERMVFATKTKGSGSVPNQTRITYADGGIISGKLVQVAGGKARLKTQYSKMEIGSSLTKATGIVFLKASKARLRISSPFRFFCDDGNLQGNLVGSSSGSAAVHFLPIGGISPNAIAAKCKARIVRTARATATLKNAEKYPDRLYLVTKELIPCRIDRMDDKHVHLQTPYSSIQKVAHAHIKAVEFGAAIRKSALGLGDSGWEKVKGKKIQFKEKVNKITLQSGDVIGHKTFLTGDSIRFKMQLGAGRLRYGSVVVRLCLQDWQSRENAPGVRFLFQSTRITISPATAAGNRFAIRGRSVATSRTQNGRANIELKILTGRIQVKVNGQLITSLKYDEGKISGRGLLFNNSGYPNVGRNGSALIISDLQVTGQPLQGRFIQAEAKAAALTTPRFRRDNPPEHVLIAPNADLLRGRLRLVTKELVVFQSRLDDFRFQRSQVAAIVWLQPRQKAIPQFDGKRPWVRALLTQGQIINVQPSKMTDKQLIGRSPILETCRLSFDAITELHVGGYGSVDEAKLYADWKPRLAPEPKFAGGPGSPGAGGNGNSDGPLVGTAPNDFQLTTLKGGKYRLSEQKGEIVVLDFWATWCAPCIRAMPKYMDVTKKYDPKVVQFVAVNQAENSRLVKQFLTRKGWKIKVAMDTTKQVAGQFAVKGIPHTVVIGPDGKIKWAKVGFRPGGEQELKKAIDELVAKLPKRK